MRAKITAAKNKSNDLLVRKNIKTIKKYLFSYGVLEDDIQVNFKIDMGEEPTRFIKVVSNLKALYPEG